MAAINEVTGWKNTSPVSSDVFHSSDGLVFWERKMTKNTLKIALSAIALGLMASAFYGNPSEKLRLVGVTGTNGKTTTATLLYKMAGLLGHKSGLLSTVVNYIGDTEVPATHTTPDQIQLNALLARMWLRVASTALWR